MISLSDLAKPDNFLLYKIKVSMVSSAGNEKSLVCTTNKRIFYSQQNIQNISKMFYSVVLLTFCQLISLIAKYSSTFFNHFLFPLLCLLPVFLTHVAAIKFKVGQYLSWNCTFFQLCKLYVLWWIKYLHFIRFWNHCNLFSFMFYTASQLCWNWGYTLNNSCWVLANSY